MTVMPWLSKRITAGKMLAHWGISITGNFIGSALMALLILLAGVHASNGGAWGLITLNTSLAKVSYDWPRAFFLGLLANFAVCLAVWRSVSAVCVPCDCRVIPCRVRPCDSGQSPRTTPPLAGT